MNTSLMRGSDLIGHPVVDLTTGDDLAEIKDVVFDAGRGAVVGFTLRRRGFLGRRLKQTLVVGSVASVGTHAVMVDSAECLAEPGDVEASTALESGGEVLHGMVITESGRDLGTVRDVVIRGGADPRVVGFEIGGGTVGDGLIPTQVNRGVSSSALIVPDGFQERVRSDLTGLAAELASIERGG